jgi:hypothetical protein
MLKNRGAAVALMALIAVGFYGVRYSSPPPQNQYPHQQSGKQPNANNQNIIYTSSSEFFIWFVEPEHLTAISTAVIAFFTATLFFATFGQLRHLRRSVDLARINADALMAAEGAHLFPIIKGSNLIGAHGTFAGPIMYDRMSDDTVTLQPSVTYAFKNYGKSPAIISEIMHGMQICNPSKRIKTIYKEERSPEIVDAKEESASIELQLMGEIFTYSKARAVANSNAILLFYGHVIFSDFFGRPFMSEWEFIGDQSGFRIARYKEHLDPDAERHAQQ